MRQVMQYGRLMKDGKKVLVMSDVVYLIQCPAPLPAGVRYHYGYSTWLSQARSTSTVGYCTSTSTRIVHVQYLEAGEYVFCVSIIRVLALSYCEF